MPDFSLLVGPDDLLAEAVLMGAHGGMAGGSNVRPRLFVELYEAPPHTTSHALPRFIEQVIQLDDALYRSADDPHNPVRRAQSRTVDPGNMRGYAYAASSAHIEQRARANPAISLGVDFPLSIRISRA